MATTFESLTKFTYLCTNHDNIILEHRRIDNNKWRSEKRDRYGNVMGVSIRADNEMRLIYNHMMCVAECTYLSLSSNKDFSPYSV